MLLRLTFLSAASFVVATLLVHCVALAQPEPMAEYLRDEMTTLPAPVWVQMKDQGETNPKLRGMRAPEGVQIDIVASDPTIIDPVGMTFADDGSLYVLEWREATDQVDTTYDVHYQDGTTATVNRKIKNVKDDLKRLYDTNGDGNYDKAELIMNDLEMPSSLLLHDDWMYFPSIGHVIRRRLSAAGNGTWEEEEILRGMCGYHHHQVSGLTLSHDNWTVHEQPSFAQEQSFVLVRMVPGSLSSLGASAIHIATLYSTNSTTCSTSTTIRRTDPNFRGCD